MKESKETFEEAEQETAALRALLDVRQGLRWLGVHDFERPRLHPSLLALFDGSLGDPRSLLTSDVLRSQADQAQPSIKITLPRGRNHEPQPITQDELRLNAARALARARERADDIPALGGRVPGRLDELGEQRTARRLRCDHRQSALGSPQDAGSRVVCLPPA